MNFRNGPMLGFNPTKCEDLYKQQEAFCSLGLLYSEPYLSKAVTCVKYLGVIIDCNPVMNMLTEFPTKLTQQMHFTEHQALSTTVKETCYKVMVIKTYNMPVQFGHHIQVKNIQSLEAIQRKV